MNAIMNRIRLFLFCVLVVIGSVGAGFCYSWYVRTHQKPAVYWDSATFGNVQVDWRPGALTAEKIDMIQKWLEQKRLNPDAHDSLYWDSAADDWFGEEK